MTTSKPQKNGYINRLFRYLYRSVRNNFRTKFIFFVIGFIIWFNINLEKEFENNINIPIKIINIPDGLTLLEPVPKTASIKIRSKGKVLAFSNLDNALYFEINAAGISDSMLVRLTSDLMVNSSSQQIEPLFIFYPQNINIKLDRLTEKKIPVKLNAQFSVAPGYVKSGAFNYSPDSVEISGPYQKVKDINIVETVKDIDKNLKHDYSKELPIKLIDSATVNYSHKNIKVFQKISKKGVHSFLAPIKIINAPDKMNIIVEPIAIKIEIVGPVNELQNISAEDFTVTADALEIDNINNTIPLEIETDIDLDWKAETKIVKAVQY